MLGAGGPFLTVTQRGTIDAEPSLGALQFDGRHVACVRTRVVAVIGEPVASQRVDSDEKKAKRGTSGCPKLQAY